MTITEEATSNVYVRPVTSKDHKYTAFIVDNVINAAYKSSESWTNTNDLVWTDRITLEAANKLIQDHGKPDILLYAIERESKSSPSSCGKEDVAEEETVIGTLIIVLNEQKEGEALLSMLAVSPKQQSRGVGKLLMTEALKYIRMHLQSQIKEAIVHVFESRQEIITWYQRLGFKDHGERVPFHDKSIMVKDDSIVILRYPFY